MMILSDIYHNVKHFIYCLFVAGCRYVMALLLIALTTISPLQLLLLLSFLLLLFCYFIILLASAVIPEKDIPQ